MMMMMMGGFKDGVAGGCVVVRGTSGTCVGIHCGCVLEYGTCNRSWLLRMKEIKRKEKSLVQRLSFKILP